MDFKYFENGTGADIMKVCRADHHSLSAHHVEANAKLMLAERFEMLARQLREEARATMPTP